MTNKELIRRVTDLVTPICQEAGVSLWDVTFEKERTHPPRGGDGPAPV